MTRPASNLDAIKGKEREELVKRLHRRQEGKCFICGRELDLKLDRVDIDHIIAIGKGLDEEQNWGLTHQDENRSKGTRDLQLMQYIFNYRRDRDRFLAENRDFTVGDALEVFWPKRQEVFVKKMRSTIQISYLGQDGKSVKEEFALIEDIGNDIHSCVGMIPFSCLFHDPLINPRSIVDLEPMIEEFYNGNPQLQPSLALLQFDEPEGK